MRTWALALNLPVSISNALGLAVSFAAAVMSTTSPSQVASNVPVHKSDDDSEIRRLHSLPGVFPWPIVAGKAFPPATFAPIAAFLGKEPSPG